MREEEVAALVVEGGLYLGRMAGRNTVAAMIASAAVPLLLFPLEDAARSRIRRAGSQSMPRAGPRRAARQGVKIDDIEKPIFDRISSEAEIPQPNAIWK